MRLVELFISEKISLTHLKNPLKKEIDEQILYSLHQIYYKEKYLDPDVKDYANRQVNLSQVTPFVNEKLKEQLGVTISLGIENILKAITDIGVSVKFQEMKTGGAASGRSITLSNETLNGLTEALSAAAYDMALDRIEDEHKIVETLFRTYKDIELRDLAYSTNIDRHISELISVVIHEMVHVVQHDAQFKSGRDNTEYRSYLSKDKDKFYGTINKIHAGTHSPEDYKIYRGSPQEIAAFAQEAALKFINNIGVDELEDLDDLKKNIPNELRWYIESMFNNPTNHKEHNVFKRFHKLMYQEVIRYIDQVQKNRRKSAKSTA